MVSQQISEIISTHLHPIAERFDLELVRTSGRSFQMQGESLDINIFVQGNFSYGLNISMTSKIKHLQHLQTHRGLHWFVRFFNIEEPVPRRVVNIDDLRFVSLSYRNILTKVLSLISSDDGTLWAEFYHFVNRGLKLTTTGIR